MAPGFPSGTVESPEINLAVCGSMIAPAAYSTLSPVTKFYETGSAKGEFLLEEYTGTPDKCGPTLYAVNPTNTNYEIKEDCLGNTLPLGPNCRTVEFDRNVPA
jgi:hypothetical protein